MVTKIILLSFLAISCGPAVKVPTKLKEASALQNKDHLFIAGVASKTPQGNSINGMRVSSISSKNGILFFEALPMNTQVRVLYIGGSGKGEVIIEEIKKAP